MDLSRTILLNTLELFYCFCIFIVYCRKVSYWIYSYVGSCLDLVSVSFDGFIWLLCYGLFDFYTTAYSSFYILKHLPWGFCLRSINPSTGSIKSFIIDIWQHSQIFFKFGYRDFFKYSIQKGKVRLCLHINKSYLFKILIIHYWYTYF